MRRFWVGFSLTVVTLGVYGLYWHYRTHAEVARHAGRPNLLVWLWVLHVVFLVALVAMEARGVLDDDGAPEDGSEVYLQPDGPTSSPEEIPHPEPPAADPMSIANILRFLQVVTFAGYVFGQYVSMRAHFGPAVPGVGGAMIFLSLWAVGYLFTMVEHVLMALIGAALTMIAYGHLQGAYNDGWRSAGVIDPRHDRTVDVAGSCRECGAALLGAASPGSVVALRCASCDVRTEVPVPG